MSGQVLHPNGGEVLCGRPRAYATAWTPFRAIVAQSAHRVLLPCLGCPLADLTTPCAPTAASELGIETREYRPEEGVLDQIDEGLTGVNACATRPLELAMHCRFRCHFAAAGPVLE